MKRFILLSLIFTGLLMAQSCALFRPKCPILTCRIRMMHSHAEIYKHMTKKEIAAKYKDRQAEARKEARAGTGTATASDSTDAENGGVKFSTRRHQITRRKSSNKAPSDSTGTETVVQKGTERTEETEGKDVKKKGKKMNKIPRHKVTNRRFLFFKVKNKEYGMGGEQGGKMKIWRSRVTPWYKNQNPKVGQDWKKPKEQ